MNTLRQLGEFVGLGAATPRAKPGQPIRKPITLRSVSNNLHILNSSQRSSMRAMILALPNLPAITLEVEPVGETRREGSWSPKFRIHPSNGCIISTELEIFQLGYKSGATEWQLLYTSTPEEDAKMNNGGVFGNSAIEKGGFRYKITRTGIQNTGITVLEKVLEFGAIWPPEPPSPPNPPSPPASVLNLKVTNQSGGHFSISGVTWTLWQQTVSGLVQLPLVHGESVAVRPPANGQYHVRADVTAIRVATGDNELAEFRGNARGPNNVPTLVIVWPGASQLRTFSLLAEGQSGQLYNPVVQLIS